MQLNGNKLKLQKPFRREIDVKIQEGEPTSEFFEEIGQELKGLGLYGPETVDFYRVLGRKDRVLIHAVEANQYFKDSGRFNSFIRLRRDHLTKLGATSSKEISEPDYLEWVKTPKPQKTDKDTLFQFGQTED